MRVWFRLYIATNGILAPRLCGDTHLEERAEHVIVKMLVHVQRKWIPRHSPVCDGLEGDATCSSSISPIAERLPSLLPRAGLQQPQRLGEQSRYIAVKTEASVPANFGSRNFTKVKTNRGKVEHTDPKIPNPNAESFNTAASWTGPKTAIPLRLMLVSAGSLFVVRPVFQLIIIITSMRRDERMGKGISACCVPGPILVWPH